MSIKQLSTFLIVLFLTNLLSGQTPLNGPENETFAVMTTHPLTFETWARWRDVFERTCFVDVTHPEKEEAFQVGLQTFVEQNSTPELPPSLAKDGISWVLLGSSALKKANELPPGNVNRIRLLDQAEKAMREGINRGDPRAIPSYYLATGLSGYKSNSGNWLQSGVS